jgi:hypothetical protein
VLSNNHSLNQLMSLCCEQHLNVYITFSVENGVRVKVVAVATVMNGTVTS